MKGFALFLILLICLSGKTQSLSCDGASLKLFQLTAAATAELPAVATITNVIQFILSQDCVSQDIEKMIRNIAMDEDRKQEARNSASTLKAHLKDMKEIENYSDADRRFDKYDNLLSRMKTESHRYFDQFAHHHESKFNLLTQWGNAELALIDILINSDHHSDDTRRLKKTYGETLLYYIQKGSEMFSRYPIEKAHNGYGKRAIDVAEKAAVELRPTLIKWIEAVETKPEIRRRLGLRFRFFRDNSQPSDDSSQWNIAGKYKQYLPLKISDGDWIAYKITDWWLQSADCLPASAMSGGCTSNKKYDRQIAGPETWLSCYKSIEGQDYCSTRTCPSVSGNQGSNQCSGERFQIQSTVNGPINYDRKIALKYWDWDCSARGKGTYWVSRYYGGYALDDMKLYTMPCLGSVFSENDISSCKNEVFTIKNQFSPKKAKYLRNGDFVNIYGIRRGFVMKQFHQTGDKIYC